MQRWTKNTPNRKGFWWWKTGNETGIIEIDIIDRETYVVDDAVRVLSTEYNVEYWGNCPIPEPVGEKI